MSKWTIEMCYGTSVTVENVKADSREEAIRKAKDIIEENKSKYIDLDELGYYKTTYTLEEI